jgi:XTP/dITP diphosphohydrolase
METLLATMRRLRGPGGCPWDQEQTHLSLRQYLLEEAYEAVDAITSNNSTDIVEELGDVLLQVAFHSVIAEETACFSYADIETAIVNKLIRRHPHVFGDVQVKNADDVVTNWQAIKAQEKASVQQSEQEEMPRSLPALILALEVSKKKKWVANSAEPVTSEAIGEALLELVNQARQQGIHPEIALRDAIDRRLANAP